MTKLQVQIIGAILLPFQNSYYIDPTVVYKVAVSSLYVFYVDDHYQTSKQLTKLKTLDINEQ